MIRWKQGLERAPNRKLARQLPEDHVWTSQRWVTKTGDIFRRRWDVHNKTWKWDEAPVPLAFEESSGRVGLYNPSFMSLENVIATAWRKRANRGRVTLKEDKPLEARYLRWAKEEVEEEPDDVDQEEWRSLKWKIGPVSCDPAFQISNLGRLKSPDGEVTRGLLFRGRRWAAADCGLVDLGAASKTQSKDTPPLHIQTVIDALSTGHTPQTLADVTGLSVKTAWTYYYTALTYSKKRTIRQVWRIVLDDPKLCRVLWKLRKAPVISASLTDLLHEVEARLPSGSEFDNDEHKFSKLRFARAAIVALQS